MLGKLIFIGFLLFGWVAANAQNSTPKGMVLINKKMSEIRQSTDMLVVGEVKVLFEGRALIISRNFGKTFITPDHYVDYYKSGTEIKTRILPLIEGREYDMKLRVSTSLKEKLHCAGCTGNLPAVILDCTESNFQQKRNRVEFNKRTGNN